MTPTVPSNLLPWLIGSIVIGFFGVRALLLYIRYKSPLSRYFMISSFALSVTLGLWSLPFLFTRSEPALRLIVGIGDVLFYVVLVYQTRITWYLSLRSISYAWLLIPSLGLALPGVIMSVLADITAPIGISNGIAIYPVSAFGLVIQAILLMNVVAIGLLLLTKVNRQKTNDAKLNLVSIGVLYACCGLGGIINTLFSAGDNQSGLVPTVYFLGFSVFILVFIANVIRVKIAKKRS